MILTATGHRPDKLFPGGWQADRERWESRLTDFAADHLVEQQPSEVISGMALGWDTAIALAALRLGIPLTAAVPFEGQERLWPGRDQVRYREILEQAAHVEIVCRHKLTIAFAIRNEWMIDRCGRLLALYDGSHGGTHNAVSYARAWCVDTVNVWDQWAASWD